MTSIGPLHLTGVHGSLKHNLQHAYTLYLKNAEGSVEHFVNIFNNTEHPLVR